MLCESDGPHAPPGASVSPDYSPWPAQGHRYCNLSKTVATWAQVFGQHGPLLPGMLLLLSSKETSICADGGDACPSIRSVTLLDATIESREADFRYDV